MKTHSTGETVRYFETDRMKVAHHTTYLVWFEIGRTGLMEEAGFSYRAMEEDGFLLPVIEFSCSLKGSSEFSDRIRIETWVDELRSRTITFAYRISNNGKIIAEGKTKHICTGHDNKYKRIPSSVIESLKPYTRERKGS